jgi:septum formation protein
MENSTSSPRRLVLASASPRRREYLERLGYRFEVAVPGIEERARPGEGAVEYVERNAREKAADVAARAGIDAVVVAADTVVVLDGRILEKPDGEADAREMLRALSGRSHQVVTGVCARGPARDGEAAERGFSVSTDVEFKELPEEEIEAYVCGGEPMDKAGAYAIQGGAAYMVRRIAGSYTNVVGLPLAELEETLSGVFGIRPSFR